MNCLASILGFLGAWEIVLIVLVILLIFGGKKIPELMRGLGKGVKSFKEGMNDDDKGGENRETEDGGRKTGEN